MTATDRTHEPDETFRVVLDRIEGAPEAHPTQLRENRDEAFHRHIGAVRGPAPWSVRDEAKYALLGNPFRAEGEPGVDG